MELRSIQKALVVGGGHGIGLALVNRLRETAPNAQVFATYRDESKAAGLIESSDTSLIKQLDPSDEGSLEQLSRSVEQAPGTLHLLINATGWLHAFGAGSRGPCCGKRDDTVARRSKLQPGVPPMSA